MTETGGAHAALMDKVYRRQRYIYDLTRRYYLFGRDKMIRELALRPGEAVVEVGCGTARNLIRIAKLYPGTELFGLDASQEMLRTAEQNIAAAGLSDRITLCHGYAEALTPALFGRTRPFDRVLFPYSLSMIPDWRQALNAAGAALADDGRLHAVDFGDLTGLGPLAVRRIKKPTIPARLSCFRRAMPFSGRATNAEFSRWPIVMLRPRHRLAGIPRLRALGGSVWWTGLHNILQYSGY
jgi:S-adenosylmethionine-diacylgycerolhomoserine-N-methlytransferase